MPAGRVGGLLTGLRYGAAKFSGFALSMLLLAVAALLIIPVMIQASGVEAWGKIAVGQAVGAVAAVVVAFGWGISGPARIARGEDHERLREFCEALVSKALLFLPVGGITFAVAWLAAGSEYQLYAGVAAVFATSIGLTTNWYFVGLARPYTFLVVETLPRVLGTVVGIACMSLGSGALVGLLCQLAGMLLAAVCSSTWILTRTGAGWPGGVLARVPAVLAGQRHGLSATVMSAAYSAAPVFVVGLVAPGILPAYALLDKVQRQINAGLGSYVTVLQGWVPRGPAATVRARIRSAMLLSTVLAAVGAVALYLLSPVLLHWLGGQQIRLSWLAMALMSVLVATSVVESVYAKACLPALSRVDVVARATSISMVLGLALVLLGAWLGRVETTAAAVVVGLLLRLLTELVLNRRAEARGHGMLTPTAQPDLEETR